MRPGTYSGRGDSAGLAAGTPFAAAAVRTRPLLVLLCAMHALSASSGIPRRHEGCLHVDKSTGCEGPGIVPCALHEGCA